MSATNPPLTCTAMKISTSQMTISKRSGFPLIDHLITTNDISRVNFIINYNFCRFIRKLTFYRIVLGKMRRVKLLIRFICVMI